MSEEETNKALLVGLKAIDQRNNLIKSLKQIRNQLIDYGFNPTSPLINGINQTIKENAK